MNVKDFPISLICTATAVPIRPGAPKKPAALLVCMALLSLAAAFAAPASAQEEQEGDTGTADTRAYQVQPGDVLHVQVWREEGLDQEVLVRPDGGFSFPLAGDISAVGRTVEELQAEITSRLERLIPGLVVTVSVREINGNKVYVLGQVNNPGEFVMNPRIDVVQALSIAGGTTAFAATNDIFVLRRENGRQVALPFQLNDIVRQRNLEQNILLESGDVVVVP
ncbi:MAG: polysaccharide biosynthesis/export family protein [Gammaproteobacteria bacterium]|nr:polysaccharide biosynthesis/export family protein [Gammaproteobacteria bacterium]